MAAVTARQRLRSDRGAELIELALVLPILLFVLGGIMDFGLMFQRYEVLTNAAREGARVGVLPGYAAEDVEARVGAYLATGGITDGVTTTVTYGTAPATASGQLMNVITVQVDLDAPFLFLGPLAGLLGGGSYENVTLRSATTMRRELAAVAAGS